MVTQSEEAVILRNVVGKRKPASAALRFFYNVNRGSSEAVAYIDEEKMVAMFVMSSKTRSGLNEAIPRFRSALQTYTYMDVRFAKDPRQAKGDAPQLPKN